MGTVSIALPYDDRWYFSEVLRGVAGAIGGAGHDLAVHVVPPGQDAAARAASVIEEDFTDAESIGAIAAGFKYRRDQVDRSIVWKRPLVIIGGGSVLGFPVVTIDEIGAASTVTKHLLDRGHRRIVHFAGQLDAQMDFLVDGRRARGYRQTMESAGLEPRIIENPFDPDTVYETAVRVLSEDERPTAVFAVSDEIAFPVLRAVRDLGLEGAVAVAGIDDHPASQQEHLTTVRQVPAEIGATASGILLGGLDAGPNPKQSRLHPTTLVTRSSTTAPTV